MSPTSVAATASRRVASRRLRTVSALSRLGSTSGNERRGVLSRPNSEASTSRAGTPNGEDDASRAAWALSRVRASPSRFACSLQDGQSRRVVTSNTCLSCAMTAAFPA